MDSSEEMRNKTTSEEVMNNNKTEGEIKDSAAEAVTGGFPIIFAPTPEHGPMA